MASPPAHARPSHQIDTPRLIIRSSLTSDAAAFLRVRSDPLNNPYGGVRDPNLDIDVQKLRLETQKVSTSNGENAFMSIVLKDSGMFSGEESMAALKVEDGYLIGMTGFNSFPTHPSPSDPSRTILVGDTGALIDHHFSRKGLAMEALSAVFEYGFRELGCGEIFMETFKSNTPFKALIRTMGLEQEAILKTSQGEDGSLMEEVEFRFDRMKWDEAKREMVAAGRWYLKST